eukprot:TRINITY_DN102896_c0_g1_i1.p1 TRINITY_DN102896_c0_g1~~TRINITY_DN102896_c0_g1_i1.p1  ORF type:complete len:410 (-),score=32.07 TRINITY_DN102896_c0_g1_i1:507-1658(-)
MARGRPAYKGFGLVLAGTLLVQMGVFQQLCWIFAAGGDGDMHRSGPTSRLMAGRRPVLQATARSARLDAVVTHAAAEGVEVYDGMLSGRLREALLDADFGVYRREAGPQSLAEEAMEHVLTAFGDESREIEYWPRDEWMPVEAHRDVDEMAARLLGVRRLPETVNIAYVDIEEGLRAPTLVWEAGEDSGNKSTAGALHVVPAVSGRLLRFPGSFLHAVPCPVTQLLDEPLDESRGQTHKRRVVIFNTWPDGAPEEEDEEENAYDDINDGEPSDADNTNDLRDQTDHLDPLGPCANPETCLVPLQMLGPEHQGAAGTALVTRAFGTDSTFSTTVAAGRDVVVSSLHEAGRPTTLPLRGFFDDDPAVGVPSQIGTRQERRQGMLV